MSDQHSYFVTETTVAGQRVECVTSGSDRLSMIERACCRHIDNVLWRLRPYTRERFWLFLMNNPVPDIRASSEGKSSVGKIALSTGLLSALCALSARTALIMADTGYMTAWLPTFQKTGNLSRSPDHFDGFKPFALSEAKRQATAFGDGSLDELAARLRADSLLLVNTLKLASTALEFAILHEIGHFDAVHDEAKRIQFGKAQPLTGYEHLSFRPNLEVNRIFEHQADIFALRLMIASATFRPILDEAREIDGKIRTEANLTTYIGASLNFALATLLRSEEPAPGRDILLAKSPKGEHPLPSTRLAIADTQIRHELNDPAIKDRLWPDPPKLVEVILQGMRFHTSFLAMTSISKDWRTAINTMTPERPTVNLEFALDEESDLEVSLSYLTAENEELAKTVMFAAGHPQTEHMPGGALSRALRFVRKIVGLQ